MNGDHVHSAKHHDMLFLEPGLDLVVEASTLQKMLSGTRI